MRGSKVIIMTEIIDAREELKEQFAKLCDVMKRLRAKDGCPWDREQTYMSLRRYILEEAYELITAIEDEDKNEMLEELGDLLLQVVFIGTLAEEIGDFKLKDSIEYLTNKLIRRHPHVFGDVTVKDSNDVLKNWEAIKKQEREKKKTDSSCLAGIPRGMPALLRSYRMQEKAAKRGFDWEKDDVTPVMAKVEEEMQEVKEAITEQNQEHLKEEIGDVLFASVNLSRHLGIDPEDALHCACKKFEKRFRFVENEVAKSGGDWNKFSLDELDTFWNKAKETE